LTTCRHYRVAIFIHVNTAGEAGAALRYFKVTTTGIREARPGGSKPARLNQFPVLERDKAGAMVQAIAPAYRRLSVVPDRGTVGATGDQCQDIRLNLCELARLGRGTLSFPLTLDTLLDRFQLIHLIVLSFEDVVWTIFS
jgi:hypothetical protein